ncbi:MAG: AzlC family ABC transporter permease [Tepidanaerobacteraceae bacterium]|jgi:4-azaleucine resistance transporter AzlC|nr:AzlC family ABC transporter permease [Tepidanaerobacteraceae bacterium]HQE05634.1 AzlC family ABC transporter permease [Tepidanaerobacteraceae bacterium]
MQYRKDELVFGIKRALPIVMGYIPVGFALGVMAADAGLSPLQMGLMSLFVYAGSAQFIAIDMLSSGVTAVPIIITTFLVNLRHFLFSASLAPYFRKIKQGFIPLISFFITDESFAVSITDAEQRPLSHFYYFGLYITAYSSWVVSTVIGATLGNLIPDTKALGFDFALPGMFLALLCMQMKNARFVLIALISGFLSIFFIYTIPGNWNVILATIIAAMIGVFLGDEN